MNAIKSDKPSVPPNLKVADVSQQKTVKPEDAVKEKPKAPSSLLSQREAVYQQIIAVLRDEKVAFDGSSSVKPLLTEDRLKKVYTGIALGFTAKKVALKENENNRKKLADPALLHTYVIGLTNNWVRRDDRLNGKGPKKS